jgi:hypothetical protein
MSRPKSRPRRVSSLRLRRLSALWVVLYTLGLFVATAHFSFVEHRVCEHGEVAHEGSGHSHAGESLAAEVAGELAAAAALESALDCVLESLLAAESPPSPAPEHDDEEPAHEHCEFDQGVLVARPLELTPLTFAEWLEEHFGRPAAHAPRPPAIAILRLAPGHSPPRA